MTVLSVKIALVVWFISLLSGSLAKCNGPKVAEESYSTSEALMSAKTVFLTQYELTCDSGDDKGTWFAEVNSQLLPVAKGDENKYQVTWTTSHEDANPGEYVVKFYDDEGAVQVRKVFREGNENTVTPAFSIVIKHEGASTIGWISPELMAVLAAVLLWYAAYSKKCRIQEN